jgi:hypothetical protein
MSSRTDINPLRPQAEKDPLAGLAEQAKRLLSYAWDDRALEPQAAAPIEAGGNQ